MNAEMLLGSLIRGVLAGSGRRKRGRRAARYLTEGSHSFLNTSTLLTVAGLAWGLYESAKPGTKVPGAGPPPVPVPAPPELATGASPELLRLIRLTISAARADGDLSQTETDEILQLAREAGAEALMQQELAKTVPLVDIVAGVMEAGVKEDLYTLAFSIVHADEGVKGSERIYLAQLVLHLGLDSAATARLESNAQAKIRQFAV